MKECVDEEEVDFIFRISLLELWFPFMGSGYIPGQCTIGIKQVNRINSNSMTSPQSLHRCMLSWAGIEMEMRWEERFDSGAFGITVVV